MASKLSFLRATALALLATCLFAASCGGSDNEAGDGEVQLTVEAAAEGSVDLSKVESQLGEVLAEVKALKSYFNENEDGSVSFTPATIPEVKKDRTYGFAFPLPSTIEATYTGKGFAAFLECLTKTDNGPVMFWNTFNSQPEPH